MAENPSSPELTPGDSVIDEEDDNPSEAIVIWRPDERTITDWEYDKEEETITTADENPEYPADEQLVVVAYRNALDDDWPDWQDAAPTELYDGTGDREINQYGFPEGRLHPIEPGELDADWLDGLADRLQNAGWDVTREPTELIVEQRDEQYRITADGTVEGEGEYRTPLETLVEKQQR